MKNRDVIDCLNGSEFFDDIKLFEEIFCLLSDFGNDVIGIIWIEFFDWEFVFVDWDGIV